MRSLRQLNFLFFYEKILQAAKSTTRHQKAQKRNQAKAQKANEQTKINALKKLSK